MFEKFLSMNEETFRARYEGTYGFFIKSNKQKILVKLVAIRGGVCLFHDSQGTEYKLNSDAKEDIGFEFIPPKANYYNTEGNETYLISRIAARQFSRGINHRNTSIRFAGSGGLQTIGVSFDTLNRVYLQTKTIKEAYTEWDRRLALAVSDQVCLWRKTGTIQLYDKKIGTFVKDGNRFDCKLDEPNLWRTELSDAFKAMDCTSTVI